MKNKTLLLMLLPFAATAQETNQPQQPCIKIHYQTVTMHSGTMMMTSQSNPGDLTFCGNTIHLPGPVGVDFDKIEIRPPGLKAAPANNGWIVVAHNVELSSSSNPVSVSADILSYNDETQTGVLIGHVTQIENGGKRKLGKRAVVDFCNNDYRIVSIR